MPYIVRKSISNVYFADKMFGSCSTYDMGLFYWSLLDASIFRSILDNSLL